MELGSVTVTIGITHEFRISFRRNSGTSHRRRFGYVGCCWCLGLGRLASGGDIEDAVKDGALAFGIGSIPGVGSFGKSVATNLGISAVSKQAANKAIANKGAEGVLKVLVDYSLLVIYYLHPL